MIELKNLCKIFKTGNKSIVAAENISMRVKEGEICVLLGPSGCGKTTTLKMINKIIEPTSGEIFVNGKNVTNVDNIVLRRKIGYVIQQIGLFPNLTVKGNISIVPKMLHWDKERIDRRAEELMEMISLDKSYLSMYPKELSGGQQQRIGVARALAANPPVMLMDEPFGAIDPINREIIQDEFLRLQKKIKKTIIMVSHDITEAIKMADKIAIFKEGVLQQFDTPDNILAHPGNSFVENFVGKDRTLKRLNLYSVVDVMNKTPFIFNDNDNVCDAIKIMHENSLASVFIVDKDKKPVGRLVLKDVKNLKKNDGKCINYMIELKSMIKIEENLRNISSQMYLHSKSSFVCVDNDDKIVGEISQDGISNFLNATYKKEPKGYENV
ncbi:MAG: betaine/proline/choline family ABC transporter ATP-binding protein [Epsilonproteobacteria bacterium]|nr:betaine/proline/choline family ABC transporter ATP-binding protein [Campylobacterota bacterium]